jgi:hypothetical protein
MINRTVSPPRDAMCFKADLSRGKGRKQYECMYGASCTHKLIQSAMAMVYVQYDQELLRDEGEVLKSLRVVLRLERRGIACGRRRRPNTVCILIYFVEALYIHSNNMYLHTFDESTHWSDVILRGCLQRFHIGGIFCRNALASLYRYTPTFYTGSNLASQLSTMKIR